MASVDAYRRSSIVCGRGFARRRLALADVQVEPDALVQLLLLRDTARRTDSSRSIAPVVVVPLQRLEAPLVERDRLEVGRARAAGAGGRWRRRRRLAARGRRGCDVGLPTRRRLPDGFGLRLRPLLRHELRLRLDAGRANA